MDVLLRNWGDQTELNRRVNIRLALIRGSETENHGTEADNVARKFSLLRPGRQGSKLGLV